MPRQQGPERGRRSGTGSLLLPPLLALPRSDRNREGFEENRGMYPIVVCARVCMFFCLQAGLLLIGSGVKIPIPGLFLVLIGLLFVVFGAVLTRLRPNTPIGIRLPWTLRDEENGRRTHHQGGYLFSGGGLVPVGAGLFPGRFSSFRVS